MTRCRRRLTALSVLVAAAGAGPPAFAACAIVLTNVETATWNGHGGGYDVFDPTSFTDRFTFEVLHRDPAGVACDVVARVAPVGRPELKGRGRATLTYEIRTSDNRPVSGDSLDFTFELEPGRRKQLTYAIRLPAQQAVSSGNFDGRLALTAFEDVAGVLARRDSGDTPIRVDVASAARISFVGAVGRRQDVDFGELTDRKKAPPVFLDVRSTADYEIRMTSQQRGRLAQTVDGTTWEIAYEATLDGARVDLSSSGGDAKNFSGPTDAAGHRMPLDLRLGTVGNKRAGIYKDLITIEVTTDGPGS